MRKLIAVLGEFGFASLGLTEKDFLVPGSIIQLGYPPNRIDLVTSISGVTFADAWECRIGCHVEGLTMFVVDKRSHATTASDGRRPHFFPFNRPRFIGARWARP